MALSASGASGASTRGAAGGAGAAGGRATAKAKGSRASGAGGVGAERGAALARAERALGETLGRRGQLERGHPKARVDLVDGRRRPRATGRRQRGGSRLEANVFQDAALALDPRGQLADLAVRCHDLDRMPRLLPLRGDLALERTHRRPP